MKKALSLSLIMLFVLNLLCLGQAADYPPDSKPASTNIQNAQYPRVTSDLRAIFRVRGNDAQKVQISLGKTYDMVKDAQGFWTVTTDPLVPGFHYYSLVIDGIKVSDPASESFFGTGSMSSAIEIPSAVEDFYTIKNVPHGDIRIKSYYSKTTAEWRKIYIYCPPGYDKNINQKYPVLYIFHGGGEDQRGWAVQGMTDVILDNLIADGKTKPMLIVMESSSARKPGEPLPQPRQQAPAAGAARPAAPGAQPAALGAQPAAAPRPAMNISYNTFQDVMLNDLIPFIEGNFRALGDGQNRAMSGLSMGGMVTTSIAFANLDKFGYIGCFSGGPRITPTDDLKSVYNGVFADPATFNKKVKLLFISNGSVEGNSAKDASDLLKKAGINNVVFYQSPGTAHEWLTWRRSLNQFASLLFK
jgi:enterochelin esterase-like enzyme